MRRSDLNEMTRNPTLQQRARMAVVPALCVLIAVLHSATALRVIDPFRGNCNDLFQITGAVYRQVCLFTNPPSGILEIPMLVGQAADGSGFAYFESIFNAPPSLGPLFFARYGSIRSQGTYNQSTSCGVAFVNSSMFSSDDPRYQPVPDANTTMNVMEEYGLGMYGDGEFCLYVRMYGPTCQVTLDLLQSNITTGVPAKKILFDSAVCEPEQSL